MSVARRENTRYIELLQTLASLTLTSTNIMQNKFILWLVLSKLGVHEYVVGQVALQLIQPMINGVKGEGCKNGCTEKFRGAISILRALLWKL